MTSRAFLLQGAAAAVLFAAASTASAAPESTPQASGGQAVNNGGKSATEATAAPAPTSEMGEVVVTARRHSEAALKTPVTVTALGREQLRISNVNQITDISSVVPGVNLFTVGASQNVVFSIRGMSRGTLGFEQPAVTSYINDVPMPSVGSNITTYDLQSVQVLKGAQGTLFGRNSETGAILLSTQQPNYGTDGYLTATGGSYSWAELEGAVNVPLIADHLAIRLAGNFDRRDGYTKNMSFPGNDFNNIHGQSVRASVLFEPVAGIRDVLVVELRLENQRKPTRALQL